jgi:hypothetical protein
MKHLTKIFILATLLLGLTACFKEENQGTLLKIAVYSQNVSSDPITKTTTEIDSYAFYVPEKSKWEVKSWEDALECRITNTERNEQRNNPDVIGTFSAEAEYQVELDLWSESVFMVVVDRTNKIFATRYYDTPMNIPETYTQLHLYAWRNSGSANGWTVTNPFPDEQRESLVEEEQDNETQE